jgi:hypothetical protein
MFWEERLRRIGRSGCEGSGGAGAKERSFFCLFGYIWRIVFGSRCELTFFPLLTSSKQEGFLRVLQATVMWSLS